jgi:4-amino-4-deoxy-L-arabinose transferase-like glycosyltransferase
MKLKQLLILFSATIFSFLPTFFLPVTHVDEGVFASLSRYAFSGQLYETYTDLKPPLLFQIYNIFSLGGQSMLAFHILQCLWLFAAGITFYFMAKRLLNAQSAFWGALLFCLLAGRINYGGGMPERLLTPLIVFATFLALYRTSVEQNWKRALIALAVGLLVGAASVVKQPGGLLGIAAFLILFLQKDRLSAWAFGIFGIISAVFFSFLLTGVDFNTIWEEAYAVNFNSYMLAPIETPTKTFEILKNVFAMYFIEYTAITIGALFFLGIGFRRLNASLKFFDLKDYKSLTILIALILFLFTALAISLGGRFYTNYQIMALFSLVTLSTLGIYYFGGKKLAVSLISLAIASNLIFHTMTFYRVGSERFKDWDSRIQKLKSQILENSSGEDFIWISHGLPSLYFETKRDPAVKFIHFMHNLNYVDVCLIPEDRISEQRNNPHYDQILNELHERKPKLIFWTSRAKNSCTDRLKLEYFPEIKELLDKSYERIDSTELGRLFLRKNS